MFGSIKATINNDIETIIGNNTVIKGDISGSSTLRIDGTVEGNISVNKTVIVGESGFVQGNISAGELLLSGRFLGNATIEKSLHIYPTGQLDGDIKAKSLKIDRGGIFRGRSDMGLNIFQPALSN